MIARAGLHAEQTATESFSGCHAASGYLPAVTWLFVITQARQACRRWPRLLQLGSSHPCRLPSGQSRGAAAVVAEDRAWLRQRPAAPTRLAIQPTARVRVQLQRCGVDQVTAPLLQPSPSASSQGEWVWVELMLPYKARAAGGTYMLMLRPAHALSGSVCPPHPQDPGWEP